MKKKAPSRHLALSHKQLMHLERASTAQDEPRGVAGRVAYHAYSIWLFTFSDLKTIVGPSTAFAIVNYLACAAFELERPRRTVVEHAIQVAKVVLWLWINLLPFNIDNQRQSIDEDVLNKPWRTLPSHRMTARQATASMFALYPIAILVSLLVGSYPQSLALIGLGIWYNDLKGADKSWFVRNFINACGFICFATGALQIMLRNHPQANIHTMSTFANSATGVMFTNKKLCSWLVIIGNIVLSTIQIQDMHDQNGDKQHGRKSMPLVLGDQVARWTIAIATIFWSWFCPYFWSLSWVGFTGPVMLGTIIAWRTLSDKSISGDKVTFSIWNAWLVTLYGLPLTVTWLTQLT